jgi:hypothetical protein
MIRKRKPNAKKSVQRLGTNTRKRRRKRRRKRTADARAKVCAASSEVFSTKTSMRLEEYCHH